MAKKRSFFVWFKNWRLWLSFLSVVFGALSLVVLSYHLAYFKKIYPFVEISGIEVSNQTQEQAIKTVQKKLNQLDEKTIYITLGNQRYPLDLESHGLSYQVDSSVNKAYLLGRNQNLAKNFYQKWHNWFKGEDLTLEYTLSWFDLEQRVASIAGQVDHQAQEPEITLEYGQVKVFPGKDGQRVNEIEVLNRLENQLPSLDFSSVEMPIKSVKVALSETQVKNAQTRARKLVGKSLRWQALDQVGTISDQELISLIDPYGGWSSNQVNLLAQKLAKKVNREPVNAVFEAVGDRVKVFQPSRPGIKIQIEPTEKKITQALQKLMSEGEPETIELEMVRDEAEITTQSVNSLGISQLIGEGNSTFYHSSANRIHNIQHTVKKLNGVLVKPGEEFSFNENVGEISQETGYKPAYIIKQGRTILGDGGGVCQVSTTTFRAALDAGLNITERHPHSYRVGYYEQNSDPGIDATIYPPSVDLKFKNDTPAHILIQAKADVESKSMKIEVYGQSDGRQVKMSEVRIWDRSAPGEDQYIDDPNLPQGTVKQIENRIWGIKTAFDWKVVRNGEILHEKTFYSNYQPWRAVFLRGTGPAE